MVLHLKIRSMRERNEFDWLMKGNGVNLIGWWKGKDGTWNAQFISVWCHAIMSYHHVMLSWHTIWSSGGEVSIEVFDIPFLLSHPISSHLIASHRINHYCVGHDRGGAGRLLSFVQSFFGDHVLCIIRIVVLQWIEVMEGQCLEDMYLAVRAPLWRLTPLVLIGCPSSGEIH